MRLATFIADGEQFWGVAEAGGMIALSSEFPRGRTLRNVIEAGAIGQLLAAANVRAG